MATTTIQDVNSAIMFGSFTNEQLDSIVSAIKFRRGELSKSVKRSLVKGATVEFYSSKRGINVKGTVYKIAIKYVTVSTPQGLWRVPANMLTVTDE
jgi:hypothetical protein